jgi:hypothetical protein
MLTSPPPAHGVNERIEMCNAAPVVEMKPRQREVHGWDVEGQGIKEYKGWKEGVVAWCWPQ